MIVRGSGSTVYDDEGRALHRRDGRALVRQRRLRAPGDRRRAARADAASALLPLVLVDGDRHAGAARGATDRDRARRRCRRCSSAPAAPTPTTPRSSSSGSTTTCSAGRRRRRSSRGGVATTACRIASAQPHRLRRDARRLRPADRRHHAHDPARTACGRQQPGRATPISSPAWPPSSSADRGRGPGDGGGVHRRAGPGRRRRDRPARGLLPGDPGGAAQARRAADRRRGRLRVRPPGHLVRQRGARHRARPDDRRQGHHLGLLPAVRLHRVRAGLAGARPTRRAIARSGTATPTPRIRSPRPARWPTSTSSSATGSSLRPASAAST